MVIEIAQDHSGSSRGLAKDNLRDVFHTESDSINKQLFGFEAGFFLENIAEQIEKGVSKGQKDEPVKVRSCWSVNSEEIHL